MLADRTLTRSATISAASDGSQGVCSRQGAWLSPATVAGPSPSGANGTLMHTASFTKWCTAEGVAHRLPRSKCCKSQFVVHDIPHPLGAVPPRPARPSAAEWGGSLHQRVNQIDNTAVKVRSDEFRSGCGCVCFHPSRCFPHALTVDPQCGGRAFAVSPPPRSPCG